MASKFRHFLVSSGLLVLATTAAAVALLPRHTARAIDCAQFAYMGRGVPGSSYLNRQVASGSDYLADIASEGGGLHRWPKSKFPLKVFIADGSTVPGYRASFRPIVAEAFQEWQERSNGLVSWKQVSDPRQADIVTLWTSDVQARRGGVEAGNTVTLTAINPYTHNGTIQAAKISLLTALGGRSFSDTDMRKTALHEVGHALGLEGHSGTRSVIMYAAVNPAQTPYLRERDINTLTRLYSGRDTAAPPAVADIPRALFGQGYGNSNNYYAQPADGGVRAPSAQFGGSYLRRRFGL